MFFKRFKEKSNKKFIDKVLNSRITSVDSEVIKSIGVILSADEFDDKEYFKTILFDTFKINQNNIKIITFIKDENLLTLNSWDSCFTPKQIGWKGKIENIELQDFVNTKFDALINYYNNDCLELNLVSALSLAKFRIGISNANSKLNDFVINVNAKEIDVFITELDKYLKILNKI